MRARRLLGIILLAIATSVALVAPAAASPYGPHNGSATVSKNRVVQGSTVRVSGDGFCAGASVHLTVKQNGKTLVSRTLTATSAGVAASNVRLNVVGLNHFTLTGCYRVHGANNGTQVLTAAVTVVPHGGRLHVNHTTVHKGDTVTVSGKGFCKNASIKVRVYDDGTRYQAKKIRANSTGHASTSVKLTRKGTTTITFQGCRKAGGDALKSVTVRVKKSQNFAGGAAAFAGDITGKASTAGLVVAGGALMLLFGLGQLMFVRRRRSSAVLVEPNG